MYFPYVRRRKQNTNPRILPPSPSGPGVRLNRWGREGRARPSIRRPRRWLADAANKWEAKDESARICHEVMHPALGEVAVKILADPKWRKMSQALHGACRRQWLEAERRKYVEAVQRAQREYDEWDER